MKYIPIIAINSSKEKVSAYDIIKSKIIDHSEIVINFFDYCNMTCVFCPQDHTDRVGTSSREIISKTNIVLDYIHQNKSTNTFLIHLMGGELFQDELISEGILNDYSDFIRIVNSNIPNGITVEYNFITNLVFKDTIPVLQFLDDNNLKIAVSYDPTGRFNSAQFKIFEKNIEIFKSKIRMVSTVMTKSNITKLYIGDSYYKYLYDLFTCHWDHLLVADGYSEILDNQLPTEREIRDFYIYLVDNYPRIINVEQFLTKVYQVNKMSCTRGNSLTIFSDNSIPPGCSGSVITKNSSIGYTGGSKIVNNFIDSNQCLSCEYYSRCNLTCFINNDYKNLVKDPGGCPYKGVFEYVESR